MKSNKYKQLRNIHIACLGALRDILMTQVNLIAYSNVYMWIAAIFFSKLTVACSEDQIRSDCFFCSIYQSTNKEFTLRRRLLGLLNLISVPLCLSLCHLTKDLSSNKSWARQYCWLQSYMNFINLSIVHITLKFTLRHFCNSLTNSRIGSLSSTELPKLE